MADIEAIDICEGTGTMHRLIVRHDIAGTGTFA
jgi:hypothetical protein